VESINPTSKVYEIRTNYEQSSCTRLVFIYNNQGGTKSLPRILMKSLFALAPKGRGETKEEIFHMKSGKSCKATKCTMEAVILFAVLPFNGKYKGRDDTRRHKPLLCMCIFMNHCSLEEQ
jgi:hypothetical protein